MVVLFFSSSSNTKMLAPPDWLRKCVDKKNGKQEIEKDHMSIEKD